MDTYCDLLREWQLVVVELNNINVFTNGTNDSSAITTIKKERKLQYVETSQVGMLYPSQQQQQQRRHGMVVLLIVLYSIKNQ